jgi:hypothetical protein
VLNIIYQNKPIEYPTTQPALTKTEQGAFEMANRYYNISAQQFNLSAIMKAAHELAAYNKKMIAPPSKPYAVVFKQALAQIWSMARLEPKTISTELPVITLTETQRKIISCPLMAA